MAAREQLRDGENSTNILERDTDRLTGEYIKKLKCLPESRLLQIRGKHPSIAHLLRVKSADERIATEKGKFSKRFKGYIEFSKPYFLKRNPSFFCSIYPYSLCPSRK